MKKLIFIDNDLEKNALDDIDYAKDRLVYDGNLPTDYINSIQLISEFGTLPKEKVYELLFNPENCICTFSMYTYNHYGSANQLFTLLNSAGRNEIKNITYIDTSGRIEKALTDMFRNDKGASFNMMNAIETNNIITINNGKFYCLRIELKGIHENPFRYETIDLNELLK